MSVPKSKYKVYMYTNDYNALCTEVYRHQKIETGGNLFGLWNTSGSAVIHVVLGPGKNCRRTDTSFHQNIEYLERVGRFLNENYMLCHIGEWHSHHCLSLSKPSRGDEQTIERNFPRGMTKFLVIIANIKDCDQIVLSPYFFTNDGTRYEKAKFEVLKSDSPFSTDVIIAGEIEKGAERNATTLVTTEEHSGNTSPTRLHVGHCSVNSPANPRSSHSDANANGEEPMDTTDGNPYPPRDYPNANASSVSATSPPRVTPFPLGLADLGQGRNSDDNKASEKDVIMKKIHDELKKWFGNQPDSMFVFERFKDRPSAVEIKFKHDEKFWMVRFPKDFPTNPAKLFCSKLQSGLEYEERSSTQHILTNEVNILLSIKRICSNSARCNACKHFTKESLSQPDLNTRSNVEKFSVSINKLVDEISASLGVNALNINHSIDNSKVEINFEHGRKYWIIDFPPQFPDMPANVYRKYCKTSSIKYDVFLYARRSCGPRPLNTFETIMEAIYFDCSCSKCQAKRAQYRR